MGMKAKKECFVFEPQQWRRTVCKNCFRTEPEHKQSANTKDANTGGPSVVLRRTENVIQVAAVGSVTQSQNDSPAGETKLADAQSDRDNGKAVGLTNATRAALRKTAAIQGQGGAHGDGRRATGQNAGGGINSSASSIDARYIEELENDFFALEDKHEAVLRERNELTAELEAKARSVTELQTTLEQYKEKVALLERRCLHLEEEIKGYRERLRLPESDQSHQPVATETRGESPSATAAGVSEIACSSELQQRLNEVEQLCQEVMEENEQLKEEVEEMQREIEEMHDHFQEDDRDAMRELQRDLEAANKTCRILQFKLRKAERRFEQCEAERANLEERLARLEAELYSEADVAHIRNLEEEVRVAKEVGVRLNNELDILDEKRAYFEQENRQLKEELQVSQNCRIQVENELGRVKLEMDKLKTEKGILDKGPLQVTDKNRSRQPSSRPSLSRETSFEEQQLQRELDASRERETDLSEQLRFAEEEIRKLKRRVKDSQVENELLTKKMDRILATQSQDLYQSGNIGRQSNTSAAQISPKTGVREGEGRLPPGQLENELIMTRRQLDMAEEENLALRRKVLNCERELNMAHGELQRMQSRAMRGMPLDSPELETLRTQMNQVQTHLNRLEGERDRLEGENRRLRAQTPMASRSAASEDTEETTIERLTKQNEMLTQRIKDWNKRLRQITREVNLVGSIEREHEWMEKYNDARESLKEQETQLLRAKKRVAELQDENARLRAEERKVEQRARREREKVGNMSNMTREVMMQEISALEEELDEVTADLTAAREQACTAQLRVTFLEDTTGELRTEAERRERELATYISHLECKNQVVNKLLEILEERTQSLQADLDRYLGMQPTADSMEASAESRTSTASAGSDEVFDDSTETGKSAMDIEKQLRNRVAFLDRLLKEERRKTEIAENQLQQSNVVPTADGQLKSRQMDLLKKELEEKDELIEARDEQIADLKSRVDQARKMNDALRSLIEKDSGTERTAAQNVESNVEVASYRKEIESARKEMQILRNNLGQAEKIRERLVKENRELQEELKLREDSIFDQDDEIEKRNAELRTVKTNLDAVQKELEQAKRDLSTMKQRESSSSSGRLSAQIAQNEKIRADLHETTRQLNELKLKFEEVARTNQISEEKFTQLSTDMSQLRGTLQEKDSIIIDLNKNLKKQNEDISDLRVTRQSLEKERSKLEKLLEEAKKDILVKDQEIKSLNIRLDGLTGKTSVDHQESSQESGIGTPDTSSTRDGGTLSRRSAEVDRLRRELSMMRRERDDLVSEVKHLRAKLRIKDDTSKKDQPEGLIGLPTGNAYAKAIAAQQTTTKISLLNEHISSLNRTNVELKLHNESLQNTVIDLQRRYRSLKEQYEGEQEAWLTERVVLESKAKEQEDRKLTINNTRKLLQETTSKLFEVEASAEKKFQNLQTAYQSLEKQKHDLETKLNELEEHQKLPKVLQRFGGSTNANRPGVLAAQTRISAGESKELARRLETAERTITKLRSELSDAKSANQTEHNAVVQEAEAARQVAEQEAEDLRDRLVTMECYRQQCELFRHRHFEVEENAEREFKIWQEEREHLLYRAEEARTMVEQWSMQLQYRTDTDTEKADDVVKDVYTQMEKWCASRGKVPCLKRRMIDSLYSFDGGSIVTGLGSVPASPATSVARGGGLLGPSATSPFPIARSQAQRSTSMEWGNGRSVLSAGVPVGGHYREGSIGLGGSTLGVGLCGSALSLATGNMIGGGSNYSLLLANRCGRSVSPEVSVRKLSNYPDPTPGFLVRPSSSRQGSHDSLSSIGDYTQRSFTLPGKPPIRSAISPARKKFFEEDTNSSTTSLTKVAQPRAGSRNNSTNVTTSPTTDMTSKPPLQRPAESKSKTDDSKLVALKATEPDTKEPRPSPTPPVGTEEKTTTPVVTKSKHGSSIADRIARWASPSPKSSSKSALSSAIASRESTSSSGKKNDKEPKPQSDNSSTKAGDSKKMESAKTGAKEIGITTPKQDHKVQEKPEVQSAPKVDSRLSTEGGNKVTSKDESKSTKKEEISSTPLNIKSQPFSRQSSTPGETTSTSGQTSKRSGSVSTISPAIMALRQKFAGGGK